MYTVLLLYSCIAMQTHLDDVGLQRDALDALAAFAVAASDPTGGQGQAPPPGLSSAVWFLNFTENLSISQASLISRAHPPRAFASPPLTNYMEKPETDKRTGHTARLRVKVAFFL